jgi:hypothetical protein
MMKDVSIFSILFCCYYFLFSIALFRTGHGGTTDYSLYFSYVLLATFHLFDFDIILKFLLVCRINYGYSLLLSITSINPDCLSGYRVWTYFQPDCSSKPEYSSTVLMIHTSYVCQRALKNVV